MAEGQGADVGAGDANGADEQPQLAILAQYVKDLSFENPNAPQVFQSSGQPKLDVNVNVGVTRPGEDVYEVALKINVTAKVESATSFAVELLYNGLFGLRNVPEAALQPFLLVTAPRTLLPFPRRAISHATRTRALAPLPLHPPHPPP